MPLHHYIYMCMEGIRLLLLIPFILSFRLFNKEQKLIFIYVISNAFMAVAVDILARVFHNNMAFITIMMLIQFYILTFFYLRVLKLSDAKKRILIGFLIVGTILHVIDISLLEGLMHFNSIFISFRTFILIVYGVIFFLQLMKDESLIEQSIYIYTLPAFWFNAGLFVSLCCSFPLDLCFNYLQHAPPTDETTNIFRITAGLTWTGGIIQAILLYIGLLKIKGAKR